MKIDIEKIKNDAKELQAQLIAWRRFFHIHPEIGLNTPLSEKKIEQELIAMGLEVRSGVGGHGIVSLIRGKKPGKVLAIRADMDALPIKEETGLPFASDSSRMHACGHDAHMSMALGAAKMLAERREELHGTVKVIFQPGEEIAAGAQAMLDDGAFDNPEVDALIGLHIGRVWEGFDPGQVGVGSGAILASMDRFDVSIIGHGGHGAYPHLSVDPICIAANIINELQTIVSREVDPLTPAVITVGQIHSGDAFNIIPEVCELSGTVRTFSPETREYIARRIKEVAEAVAKGMQGDVRYLYSYGAPPVINSADFTEEFRRVAIDVVGEDNVRSIPQPSMGGEDVALFLERVPGTYFFLAASNPEKGPVYPHHHPKFDIDEDVLWIGSALFTASALRWLAD